MLQSWMLWAHQSPDMSSDFFLPASGEEAPDAELPLVDEEVLVERVDEMYLVHLTERIYGSLLLSTYRLLFVPAREGTMQSVPLGTLASVQVQGKELLLRCKTPRSLRLVWSPSERCDVHSSSVYAASPATFLESFRARVAEELRSPFVWKRALAERALGSGSFSRSFFSMEAELRRQGASAGDWRIVDNSKFEWCPTYPAHFAVPSNVDDRCLRGAAQFRSQNRLVALTYFCRDSGASIVRSSQPLTGLTRCRSEHDEHVLRCVQQGNRNPAKLYLVDARPKLNAWANTAKGAGTEIEANYENAVLVHLGIANIHVVRASLESLHAHIESCVVTKQTTNGWGAGLDASGWLTHLQSVLKGAALIAEGVRLHASSVLVHCSDGWDRTSQLCALAQLMMDPYFRTLRGFSALVQKDFLSFGHKFDDRNALRKLDFFQEREASPIFMQFIDATWQILNQHPSAFEFDENFLLTILDHSMTSRFGTFMGNCERERLQKYAEMPSLWVWLEEHRDVFLNPSYVPTQGLVMPETLIPPTFWTRFYMRFYQRVPQASADTELVGQSHEVDFDDDMDAVDGSECEARMGRMVQVVENYVSTPECEPIELESCAEQAFNIDGSASWKMPSHMPTATSLAASYLRGWVKMLY